MTDTIYGKHRWTKERVIETRGRLSIHVVSKTPIQSSAQIRNLATDPCRRRSSRVFSQSQSLRITGQDIVQLVFDKGQNYFKCTLAIEDNNLSGGPMRNKPLVDPVG